MIEQAILVGVKSPNQKEDEFLSSLDELSLLAQSAGAMVCGRIIQSRKAPKSSIYIGKGKLDELREAISDYNATIVIFNNELTGSQVRNIEQEISSGISIKVIDRTELILDIFAIRAHTAEAKLQVELAQMKYLLPRLVGKGLAMSDLGGGIGTRGPGEMKLEYDRRRIKQRILNLERTIQDVKKTRTQQRKSRKEIPVAALVGYTNAGKSTLFNVLTSAGVEVKDKLFTTLDTTTRRITLAQGQSLFLIDTVGFVSHLPHHLVSAFSATLEEVTEADIILHVVNAASSQVISQISSVNEVLSELGAAEKPMVIILNKMDMLDEEQVTSLLYKLPKSIAISAIYHQGIDKLLQTLSDHPILKANRFVFKFPISQSETYAWLHEKGKVIKKGCKNGDFILEVDISEELANKYRQQISKKAI